MDGVSKSKDNFHLENDNNYEQNQKDEEDFLCNKEIFHDISQNFSKEKDEENKAKSQYNQNEINRKESTQWTEKTLHFENSNIFKTELIKNEYEKEVYAKIQKLKKALAESKDIGNRINQILNRIKANSLNALQAILFEMLKKTDFYKNKRKNFAKINNSSYNFENSSKNLLFLKKQFKEVLSEKKENQEIIRIIMSNSDYPALIKFLNMTIEELITLFSDECSSSELEEEYFLYLQKAYKKLKATIKKEGKSNVYIDSFTYFTAHIKEVYISINEHRKNKCKNI